MIADEQVVKNERFNVRLLQLKSENFPFSQAVEVVPVSTSQDVHTKEQLARSKG